MSDTTTSTQTLPIPGTGAKADPAIETPTAPKPILKVVWPKTIPGRVVIKRRMVTSRLPETDTPQPSATGYVERIGSSFAGYQDPRQLGRVVLTREQEVAWLPELVGVAPTHNEWDKILDAYWANLSVPVPFEGLTLNTSIIFQDENDTMGKPESVADYILWKYCLRYAAVANSFEDVASSPRIRFYLWSDTEDRNARTNERKVKDSAYLKRLEIEKEDEVVVAILMLANMKVPKTINERLLSLADYQETAPAKFLELANDQNLLIKNFIERAVRAGAVNRPINTTSIMYDNAVIGNNQLDAAQWLTLPANSQVYETIRQRVLQFEKALA